MNHGSPSWRFLRPKHKNYPFLSGQFLSLPLAQVRWVLHMCPGPVPVECGFHIDRTSGFSLFCHRRWALSVSQARCCKVTALRLQLWHVGKESDQVCRYVSYTWMKIDGDALGCTVLKTEFAKTQVWLPMHHTIITMMLVAMAQIFCSPVTSTYTARPGLAVQKPHPLASIWRSFVQPMASDSTSSAQHAVITCSIWSLVI